MSFNAFNFGYDVGTFSGVQAMQPFARQFGHYDAENDEYVLAGWLRSVMTATPFIGKAAVRSRPRCCLLGSKLIHDDRAPSRVV